MFMAEARHSGVGQLRVRDNVRRAGGPGVAGRALIRQDPRKRRRVVYGPTKKTFRWEPDTGRLAGRDAKDWQGSLELGGGLTCPVAQVALEATRRLGSRRAGWARGAQAALEADGRGPDVLQLVPGQQAGAELAAVGPETCVHFTNQWGDEIFLLRA